MIELSAAISMIEQATAPLPPRRMRLCDACGRVLAVGVVSDVDSPPWDRAMMDGFAVRNDDFKTATASETVELSIVVDVAAGDVTSLPIASGTCARIMTGAPIPPGADAVVPIECAVDETQNRHAGTAVRLAAAKKWLPRGRGSGALQSEWQPKQERRTSSRRRACGWRFFQPAVNWLPRVICQPSARLAIPTGR